MDTDPRVQAVAREAFEGERRLTIMTEDGVAFLARQEAGSFDFVFADAIAGKYDALDQALNVIRRGGFYVIDDILPQVNWPEGHAAKIPVLLAALAAREDFSMVPLAWSSGLAVAVKK